MIFSLTIHKSFVRPHLDYSNIIYDQPNNSHLSDTIGSVQHNAALVTTDAIRGIAKEKFSQELRSQSLKDRRWLRQMSYFYKIILTKLPSYLCEIISPSLKVSSILWLFSNFVL